MRRNKAAFEGKRVARASYQKAGRVDADGASHPMGLKLDRCILSRGSDYDLDYSNSFGAGLA